jgi:hypothetical protein
MPFSSTPFNRLIYIVFRLKHRFPFPSLGFFLIELKGQPSEKEDIHFVMKKKTGKSFIKIYRLVISDRYLNFGGIQLKIIDTIPFFLNNYPPLDF